jgi:hypothetical protein
VTSPTASTIPVNISEGIQSKRKLQLLLFFSRRKLQLLLFFSR